MVIGEEDNSWEVEADIGDQTLVDYWAEVMRRYEAGWCRDFVDRQDEINIYV